jgi:TetR/AcrR family transcriptional regulator, repressor for uid operon
MRKADPELQSRRRNEIIAAAETCFLKRGFHQSSMKNIADTASVSMGLLYRYFANKEAIIEAAAAQDQAETIAAISALPHIGDVAAGWVTLIQKMAVAASATSYATLASEILSEANRSAKIYAMLKANDAALVMAIADKLAAQQQSGALNIQSDVGTIAHALLLVFEGLTMRNFMTSNHGSACPAIMVSQIISCILNQPRQT